MLFSLWWLPGFPAWLTFETTPLDSLLYGLVGAYGISILGSFLRTHLFLKNLSGDERSSKESQHPWSGAQGRLSGTLQFWFCVGVLSLVGSRVASLVVLEFILRAALARVSVRPDLWSSSTAQFLTQCQFSLGCALTCSLHFLQEGAPHCSLNLFLAAGLSWLLANLSSRIWLHVVPLYRLHSSQRYCGLCIGLLSSGHAILPLLSRGVVLTFVTGAFAGLSIVSRDFLSSADALRFWTPLTICYTLLVVYMHDEQRRQTGPQALLQAVGVRLGGLLVLMLTVGRWVDVLHILLCFLGEAGCLLPSRDLLDAALQEVGKEVAPHRRTERPGRLQEAALKPRKDKDL
ncbi:transmembrane protein 82 [Paramormyrops kingsleyae]|uniref:transmembrane protein 82 n=1 Tax=Paramormyrops kingsleyae TaxID=1676925 RepID=UPI003B976404